MLLYNTMTRRKEEFKPIREGSVGLYTCGPTVYNYASIGNMVSYLDWDLLKRVLVHDGYRVKHVMNITDVGHLIGDMEFGEDKVKSAALREHKTAKEVSDFYKRQFLRDEERLNIISPDVVRNASDEIEGILKLISVLDSKGYLYKLDDGLYFDTSKFNGYGSLTGMGFEKLKDSLKAGARVERPNGLRNPTDFAVWRLSKPGETDMVWDSKYGRGFPGWHIECSEISMKYLGSHFDIHCGGVDHIPTHHTNEIAQSESATGERFVNYWMHNNHMMVDGRKMSKSLGNIYTLQDIVDRGYSPLSYRYFVLSSHYRSSLNFTFEALDSASKTIGRIYSTLRNLEDVKREGEQDPHFPANVARLRSDFYDKLNDDLGTPEALKAFHEILNIANSGMGRGSLTAKGAKMVIDTLLEIDDSILAVGMRDALGSVDVPEEAQKLIHKREEFRSEKNFKAADDVRDRLRSEFGIELVDTKDGVRVRKAGEAW